MKRKYKCKNCGYKIEFEELPGYMQNLLWNCINCGEKSKFERAPK